MEALRVGPIPAAILEAVSHGVLWLDPFAAGALAPSENVPGRDASCPCISLASVASLPCIGLISAFLHGGLQMRKYGRAEECCNVATKTHRLEAGEKQKFFFTPPPPREQKALSKVLLLPVVCVFILLLFLLAGFCITSKTLFDQK